MYPAVLYEFVTHRVTLGQDPSVYSIQSADLVVLTDMIDKHLIELANLRYLTLSIDESDFSIPQYEKFLQEIATKSLSETQKLVEMIEMDTSKLIEALIADFSLEQEVYSTPLAKEQDDSVDESSMEGLDIISPRYLGSTGTSPHLTIRSRDYLNETYVFNRWMEFWVHVENLVARYQDVMNRSIHHTLLESIKLMNVSLGDDFVYDVIDKALDEEKGKIHSEHHLTPARMNATIQDRQFHVIPTLGLIQDLLNQMLRYCLQGIKNTKFSFPQILHKHKQTILETIHQQSVTINDQSDDSEYFSTNNHQVIISDGHSHHTPWFSISNSVNLIHQVLLFSSRVSCHSNITEAIMERFESIWTFFKSEPNIVLESLNHLSDFETFPLDLPSFYFPTTFRPEKTQYESLSGALLHPPDKSIHTSSMFPSTESFKTHTYYSRLVHINSPQFPVYSRIPTQEHSPKNSVDPDPISFICPRCHYSANSLVTCTNHLSLCTQFVSPEERLNFLYELQIEYVCRSLQRLSDWQTAFDAVAQNLSKFTPSINTTPHFDTKPSPRLLRTDFQMVVEWLTAIFVPVQLSATIRVDFSVVFEQYITRINEWRSIMIRFLETTTRTVTQQLELRGNEDWREVTNTEPPQSGKMTWSLLREHETLALMENEMKILNIATIPAINQIKAKHNHTPWAFKLLVKIESLLTQYGPVNAEVIGYISHAKEIHAKLSQLRKQLQDTVLKEHAFFVAQLESRRQTLMMEVKIYIARVNEMGFEADVSVTELSVSLGHLVDGTTRVLQNLMGKKATIEVLNSDESLLGEPITLSTELDQTIKRIEYLNQVFVSYQLFTGWQNDVRQITFEFDVGKDIELLRERKEILERCQNIRMEAKEERLSTPHPLEKRMMQSLEDNLTKLLILADFDKMSFRDRHWKSLETLTHSQLILASSTRKQNTQASCPLLGVLLDLDLVEVRSEITDLLHTASREQEIELELKGILKEWENDIKFEFVEAMTGTEKKVDSKRRNTSPHDTPFHLKVTEESCERIVTLAKSTSTTLRTLSFSDYIGPFKDLTEFLEQRLHNIPSLISIFMSTQNTWRTLNGVFMSSFVLEMLVKEHWTFNKITDDLNRVMRKMISEKTPFTCFCQDSFIPHVLEELHVQLEQCKKGVVSHFTKVAETSPRLSLLSESSLFTVLSYASSPLTFDPILQQLFPGVAGLVIDQKLTRSEPGEQEGIQEAFHILHNADNSNDEISSNFSEVFDVSDATSDSVSSILSPTNRRIKPRPRAKRHSLAIKPSSPFPGTLALPTPPEKPQVEIPFSANERLSIPSSSRHPKPFKSKRSTSLISIPQRMALSPQLKSVREAGSKDDKHAQSLVEQPDCVLVAGMAGGMGEVLRFPSPVPFYAGANPMHFFVQIEKAMQDAVYVSLLRTYGMVSLIFNSIRGGARQNADVVSKWHEESIDSSSTDFLDYMSVSTMTDTTQSSETGSTSFNSEAISGFGGIGDDRILGRDSFTDQTFTQFIGEPDNSEMFAFAESAGESGNLTSTQMLSSSEEKGQEISFRSENEFEKMIAIIETKIKPSELPTLGTSRSVINNSVDQCIYTSFVSHLTDEISDLIEVVSHVSNALWIEREARGHGEFDKQQAIDKLQIVSDAIVSFIEMFQTMVWSNISVILRMKIESTLLACLQSESLVNHIRHFLNGRGPQKHWSVVRQSVKNLPHLMIPVTDYNRELVESMFRDIEGTTLMSISGIHPQRSAGSQFKSSFHSPTNIYSHTHEISSTEEELTICDKWPILVIAGEESMKYGCDYLGMVCGTIRTWSRITVDEDGLNKEECETLYRTTHFWKAIIKDVNKDVSPSFGSDPSSPDLPAKQTDSKLFTLIEQGLVTESFDRVKELSVICGKYVFVMTFHVESVVPPGFAHYFQGICGSGSWAYFILPRMITHKPVEALGALFEKLHQSIDGGHKHCLLNENVLIGLKGEYHFFVEIPQKASNLELPDSLRSSLRAGVFGRVSSKSALYSGLVLSGFYFAGLLSTRINRFFELFKEIESSSVVFVESGLGRVSETIRPYFERVMYNIVRPLLQTNFKANGKFVADLLVWANVSEIDQDDNTQTFSNVSGTNIEALRRLAIEDRLRFVCECLASVLCIIAAIRPSLKGEEVQTASTLLCQIFKEIPARFIQEHLPLSDHYFEFSTLNDLNALGREVNKYTIPEEMEYNTKLIEITKHTLLFDPLLASQDIQPVPSGTVISRRNQFDLKNYAVTSFRSFSERVVDVTKKLRDKAETSFDGENSARGVSTTLAPTDQSIVFSMSAASGSQNITDQSQNHNLLVYAPEYFAQMRMSEDDHISMDFAEFTIKTVTPALKFTKDHMLKTATDAQSFMVTGASQSVVLLSQMLHHPSWCKGGRWTSIPQPQPVAVVGPAGSGKSLVIELLAMAQNSLGIPTSIVKVNPSASSFTDLFGNLISTSSNSKVDGDDLSPHSDSALTYKVGWVVSILKQYARKLMQHSFRDERHPSQNETAPIHELFLVVDLPPSTNQNAFSMDPIIDTTEKEEDSQAQNATFESFAINRSFYQAINRLESALIQEYLSRLVISRKQLRTDLANEGLVLDNPRTSDYTTIPELFNLLLRDGSLKETKAFTQKLFHLRNKNRQSRISASSRRKQRHFRTRSKQRRSPFRHHSNDDQSATVSQHPSYLEAYRTAKFEEKINKRTSRRVRKGALGVQENSYIQYLRLKLKNRRKAKELQKRTDNLLLNEIERIHQLSHNVTMQDLSLFAMGSNIKLIFEVDDIATIPPSIGQHLSILRIPDTVFKAPCRLLYYREVSVFPVFWMQMAQRVHTVLSDTLFRYYAQSNKLIPSADVLSNLYRAIQQRSMWLTDRIHRAGEFVRDYFLDKRHHNPASNLLHIAAQTSARSSSYFNIFCEGYLTNVLKLFDTQMQFLFPKYFQRFLIVGEATEQDQLYTDIVTNYVLADNISTMSIFWGVGGHAFHLDEFRDAFSDFIIKICPNTPHIDSSVTNLCTIAESRRTNILGMIETLNFPITKPSLADFFVNLRTGEWENSVSFVRNQFTAPSKAKTYGNRISMSDFDEGLYDPSEMSGDLTWGMDGETSAGHVPDSSGRMSLFTDELKKLRRYEFTVAHVIALYDTAKQPVVILTSDAETMYRWKDNTLSMPLTAKQETTNVKQHESFDCPIFSSTPIDTIWWILSKVQERAHERKVESINAPTSSQSNMSSRITSMSKLSPMANSSSQAFSRSHIGKIIGTQTSIYTAASSSISYFEEDSENRTDLNTKNEQDIDTIETTTTFNYLLHPPISMATLEAVRVVVDPTQSRLTVSSGTRQDRDNSLVYHIISPLVSAMWLPQRLSRLCSFVTPAPRTVFDSLLILQDHLVDQLQTNIPFLSRALKLYSDENTEGDAFTADSVVSTLLALLPPAAQRVLRQLLPDLPQSTEQASVVGDTSVDIQRFMLERLPDVVLTVYSLFSFLNHPTDPNHVSHRISTYIRNLFPSLSTIPILFRTCLDCIDHFVATLADNQSILTNGAQVLFEMVRSILDVFQTMMNAHELLTFLYILSTVCVSILLKRPLNFEHILKSMQNAPLDSILFLSSVFHSPIHQRLGKKDYLWQNDNILTRQTMESERLLPNPHPLEMWLFGYAKKITRLLEKSNICIVSDPDMQLDQMYSGISSFIDSQTVRLKVTQTKGEFISQLKDIIKKAISSPLTTVVLFNVTDLLQLTQQYGLASIYLSTTSSDETHSTNESSSTPTIGNVQHEKEYGHEFDYMNNIDGQRMSLLLSQEATNDPNEILSAQFASQLLRALTQARYGILYLFSESELESLADEAVLQGKIQARSVNWFVGEVRRKIKYIFEVTVCDANQHPTSYLYLEDRFRLRKVYVNDEDFGQEIQDSLNRRVKIKRRPIVLLGLDYMDWVINAFHMFRLQNYPLYQLEEPIRTVIPSGSCKQMIIKEQKAREDTPNFINFDESVKKGTNDGLLHILEKRRQDRMNKDKTMSRISRVFILDERVFTADQEPAIPVLLIPGISNFDTTTIPPLPLTSKGAFIHFLLSVSRTVRQPTRPRQIPVPPLLVSKRLSPIVTFPKPEGSVKMGPPRSLTRIGTAVVGGRRRPGNARNQKASVISGIPSRATLSHDKGSLSSIHHDRSTFTHITNKGMSSYELTRSKTSLSHDQSLSSVPRDRSPPPDLIGASSLELTIFSALIKQINQQNNPELTIDTADLTTFTLHIWKQLFHSSTIANKETTIFYAVMVSMHASVKQDYGLLTYANATSEWFTHRVVRFTSLQILKFAHMFARTYSRRITFLEQLKESQENLIKLFTAREQGRVISQPITSEMQGWNVRNFGKLFETVRKVRADMNELSLKKEDLKQRTKNLETTKRELHKDRMSITRKLNVQDTTLSEIKHKFSPSRMSNFLTGKKNNLGNNLIHEVLCLLTNQPLPRMSLLEITLTHINNGVGISGLIRQSSTLTRKLPPPIRNNGMTSLFQTISNFTAVTVTAEQIEFLEPYHELIRSDWADNALLGQNSLFEQFYHGSIADYHVRHHVAPHFKKLITLQSQFEKEMKSLHRAIVEADDLRAMILANLHDLNNTLDYVTHINHPNPQKCITPEPLEAKPENLPSREPQKSGLTQETLYNALHRIRQNIVHCRGDCMLTAAFIIFNGSIPVSDWDCQMTKWMRLLDIAGIPYTPVPHVSLPVDESGPNYATEPYEVHIHPEERVLNTNKDLLALDSTLSLSQFDLLHSLSYSNIRPTLRTVFAVLNGPSTALLGQANGLPPNELSLMGASIIRYVSDVPIMLLDWSGIMLQWLVSFYRQFGNVILTSVLSVTFFDDVIESLVRGYPLFVEYEDIHPSVDQVRCENIQNCIEVLLDCALSGHLNGVDICGRRILPQTRLRFFLCVKSATALMPPTFITNRPIEHEFVVVNCNPLCSSSLFTNWFKYGLLGPMLLPEQILVRKAAWGRIYHSYQTIASEFAQFHSNIDLGKSGIVALHAHFRSIKGLADNLHQLIQREVDVIENNDRILSHLDMFCIYIHKVHQISQSTVAVPLVHFVSYCTPKFISSRPLVESGIPSSSIFSVMVFECVRRAMMLKLYDRSLQQTKDVITQLLDGEVPEDILLPNDSGTTINYIHFNTDEIIEILNDLRDKEYPLAHINFILVTACGFLLKRILSGLKETVYTSSRKSFTRFQGKSIQIGVGLNTIGLIEPYLVPTLESRTPSTGIVEAYRHEIDLSFTEKDRYIATHFPLNTLCLDSPVTRRYIHTEDHLRLVDFCQELLSPRFLFTQPKTLAPRHLPGRLQTARARHSSTTSFFAMFDQRVSQSAATLEPIHEIPQDGLSGTEVEMLLLDEIMAIWDIPHTSLLDSFRENPIDWNDWILSDQPEQTPFPFSEEYDPYPLMWYAIITHLVPHRAAAAFYEFTRRIVVFTVEDVHIVEEDIAVAIDTSCQSIASFLHTNTHLFDIDPYIGRLENAIIHQATYSLQRKTLDVPRLFIVSMPVGEMHRHVNLSSILSEDRPIPLQMLYGRTPLTEMTFEELGKLSTVKVKMELLFGVKNIIKKSSASVDINQIERRGLCCQRPLPAFVATTGNQWMEYSVIPDFLSAIHDSTYFHLFVSIPPNLFFKTDLLASKQFTATIIKGMKDGQTTSPRSLTDYPKSRTSPWTDFIYTQHVHCDPTFIHAIPQVAEQDTGDVTAPQVIYQLTDKKHIYPRLYESCSRLLVLDKENIFRPGIHLSYVAGIVAHHIEHQTTFKALLASALARIPYDYETNVDISFWGQLLFAVVFFYTWMKWRSVTLNYSSFILTKFRKPGIYAQPFFLSILRVTRSIFQSTSSLSSCLHQLRNSIHWLLLDLKVPSDDLEVGTELLFRLLVPQLSVIPFDFVSVLDGYYDCSMSFSLPVVLSGTTFNRKHAVKYVTATFPDLSPQQVSITSSIDRMRTMSMTLIEMQTIQRSVFRLTALARTPQEQALISPSDQKNNIFMENMIDLLQFLNAEKGTTTPKFIPPVALHCPTPIFFSKLVKETHSLTAALMTLHFSICSCLDTVCLRSPLDFLTSQFRTELFSPKNSFASNRFDALFADSVPIPVYVTFNQSDVIQWFKMKHSLLTQLLSMDDPPPSVMPLSLLLNPSAFLSGFIIEGEQWLSNFSQPLGRAFFRDSHRECNENFVDHDKPTRLPDPRTSPGHLEDQDDSDTILIDIEPRLSCLHMSLVSQDPITLTRRCFVTKEHGLVCLYVTGIMLNGCAWDFELSEFVDIPMNNALGPTQTQTPLVRFSFGVETKDELILPDRYDTRSIYSLNGLAGQYHPPVSPVPLFRFDDSQSQIRLQRDSSALFMVRSVASMYEAELSRESSEKSQNRITMTPGRPNHPSLRSSYRKLFQRRNMSPRYLWPSSQPSTPLSPQKASQPTLHRLQIALPDSWPSTGSAEYNHGAGRHTLNRDRSGGNMASSVDVSVYSSAAKQKVAFRASLQHSDFEGWARKGCYLFLHFNPEYLVSHRHVFGLLSLE